MRVEITRVIDTHARRVAFRCLLGEASGRWMGPTLAQPGEFDVEIEIPDEVADWTLLEDPAADSIAGDAKGGSVSITGTIVEMREDDPVVGIRLGTDIALIEAPGVKREGSLGSVVSLNVPVIQLYPYQL